ncbi:2OG-Fe(II) oxygenase family protein [Halopseudomonas salegens]|uniref:2OG-Fe(II) oxygenase superfamily protein n=1 Tax=Halopseudomonas salegens TaxID=1434072 RepID=A0A1H2GC23_9GAMM|nr:2OG-Fe(II) oxygenase [Halopseudomonas salegens]SDU17115.1 2OG-Fe(II) oxygenase superfamily protein [Halopseudomonas salegens]
MPYPLAIGQPVPDFLLSPVKGTSPLFYEVYCGQPLLVLVADTASELQPLYDLTTQHPVLALVRSKNDPWEGLPWPLERGNASLCQRLTGCAGGKVHALLLNHELRLIGRIDNPGRGSLEAQCALLSPPPESRLIDRVAPVLLVPDVIPAALRKRLIKAWQQDHSSSGMVRLQAGTRVLQPDPACKTRLDHALTDPELNADLNQCLVQTLLPAIGRNFHYNADRFEGFKIVAYQASEQGHFAAHRDNISADTSHRRFAMTINLNDDFTGGELVFPEYGPDRYRPTVGGAIVFSCSMLHRVLPVTAGCRYAALTFFWNSSARH